MNPNEQDFDGPHVVFALYRPHDGKDEELRQLIAQHVPTLRRLELITDRPVILVKSRNGTYIEVFEWSTPDGSYRAHQHPEVARIWESMGQICDLPPMDTLEETKTRFAHFQPVNL